MGGSSRRAVTAAVAVSLSVAGVTAVHAAASTVLYVSGNTSICTDSGTGTQAAPYCTIQAAANAAVAGDTVEIASGTYAGQVDVKSVGTAAAPIVFKPEADTVTLADATGQTGPALSFDGAAYVSFEGQMATSPFVAAGVVVNGSSNIVVDGLRSRTTGSDGFHVTGTSSNVSVTRDMTNSVVVDPGSSGDVISTDYILGTNTGSGISVTGAVNTAITSDDIRYAPAGQSAISVSGSTGTSIENTIVTGTSGTTSAAITVDPASAASTTLDYNIVYPTGGQNPYSWNGTAYPNAAELAGAVGQGAHDLNTNPEFATYETRVTNAPQLDSANGSAPGMLSTDLFGNPCGGDPVVAISGAGSPAYCQRGDVQQPYVTTVTASAAAQTALSVDLTSAMSQLTSYDGVTETVVPGATPAVSYTIAWGDGQKQTVQASNTAAATITAHKYAAAGTYVITDTADLTDGTTRSTQTSVTTAGSSFKPVGPLRLLDTRTAAAGFRGPMASGTCYDMQVAGVQDIPVYATAVSLNLTITDAVGSGGVFYLGSKTSSTLNYNAGQTVANSAIVPLTSGDVDVCSAGLSNAAADVVVDVTGYFARSSGSGYQPSALDRILDTRHGTGAPLAKIGPKTGLSVPIVGVDSIPADATAVALHVTETNATGGGWIAAEPDGAGVPGTSSLNYAPGQTISNTVIVPVAADGAIELYNGAPTGSVDLIADVSGYFAPSAPEAFMPVTPYRAVDTRVTKQPLQAYGMGGYLLNTVAGIPADATFAANLTATDETSSGHLTAFPFNTTVEPDTSSLNFGKGQSLAGFGLFGSANGGDGINVDNWSDGSADIVFDVFGYFAND